MKNKRMLVIVGSLVLVIGVAFAYYTGKMIGSGEGASTKVVTANIKNTELTIEGVLEFNTDGILPGHREISALKVTAIGNEIVYYNLVWNGTNNLNTKLNYTVYKVQEELKEVSMSCNEVWKTVPKGKALSEECSITNEEKLGKVIGSGEIDANTPDQSVILVADEQIKSKEKPGEIVYYYVVLEYPNLEEEQNGDIGRGFTGEVTVEEANKTPDINIMAVYIKEDGEYKEQSEIPQSGYYLNEQSDCTNGAKPKWTNGELRVSNLTKSGTSCYLYFDEYNLAEKNPEQVVGALGKPIQQGETTFLAPDISPHKEDGKSIMYQGEDDFGATYYFRGDVDDNWLKFGTMTSLGTGNDIWWRIVRVNGDGTIRLIYAGNTNNGVAPSATGTDALLSNDNGNTKTYNYNDIASDNMYAGFQFISNNAHGYGTNESNYSNAYKELTKWFEINLKDEWANGEGGIDPNSGFCNDRIPSTNDTSVNNSGGTGSTTTHYAPGVRIWNGGKPSTKLSPTFKCSNTNFINSDYFTSTKATGVQSLSLNKLITGTKSLEYPIGLITADEVSYAGLFPAATNNTNYLNIGQNYWTMSPWCFYSNIGMRIFFVDTKGTLYGSTTVATKYGLRPVINLNPSKLTITGAGTTTNPYVAELR